MTKVRFASVVVLIVFVLGMGTYCFVFKKELYPFAPYNMYAGDFTQPQYREKIFVSVSGQPPVVVEGIGPFEPSRVFYSIVLHPETPLSPEELLRNSQIFSMFLNDCLRLLPCRLRTPGGVVIAQRIADAWVSESYFRSVNLATFRHPDGETIVARYQP